MKKYARYALFYQSHLVKIAVENDRQARDAVNQAVQESSESDDVPMMQNIQGFQNRCEGRMEEYGMRVAQMSGSEAGEASRGQRNHLLQEHQVLLQAGERENEFLKRQTHS